MKKTHSLFVGKDRYKFSAAHMTTFADGTKERLHGHNYQVALEIELEGVTPKDFLGFDQIKDALGKACTDWDERVLVAEKSPYLRDVRKSKASVEFALCGKRYRLPADEVVWLPVDNITVESLSTLLAERLFRKLGKHHAVHALEVTVAESSSQGARCRVK